jgi:hypothetical protein
LREGSEPVFELQLDGFGELEDKMGALGSGLGHGCHGLEGIEGVEYLGQDLRKDDHLGEEQTTSLILGAFFSV